MMQYSVVPSAALKADTCPASHQKEARVQSKGSSFETCSGKTGTGTVLAESTWTVPCQLSYHQRFLFVLIVLLWTTCLLEAEFQQRCGLIPPSELHYAMHG